MINLQNNEEILGFNKIDLYVNTWGRVSLYLTFHDVELDIEFQQLEIDEDS